MPEETQDVQLVECHCCGTEVREESAKAVEGEYVCELCYPIKTVECFECNERVLIGNTERISTNKRVCRDCLDENYTFCRHCEEYYHNDEIQYVESCDVSVCDSCYEDWYGTCECGYQDRKEELVYFDGRWYCDSCRREYLVTCCRCDEYEHTDDCYIDESTDDCYCRACYDRGYHQSNESLHDYNYQPDLKFHHHPLENDRKRNKLYMGFELEVEVETRTQSIDDLVKLVEDHMKAEGKERKLYFKRDGSLTNGFEIVSHPMTLRWIKKELKLNKVLDILRNKKVSSYEKGTCGFHVHLAKNFFEGTEVDKLRLFINNNYQAIYDFSKRKTTGGHFFKKENYDLDAFKRCFNQDGRYWAYNLNTHKETVEIRIFRGTLSYKRLIASMELCDAMAHYVKVISFMKAGNPKDSWRDFLAWCKRENRYHKFLMHIKYQPSKQTVASV